MATFTEHVAQQISNIINKNSLQKVLCTGGGTYNTFLIEKIRKKLDWASLFPKTKSLITKKH